MRLSALSLGLVVILGSCDINQPNEEMVRWITPPRENLKLMVISQTDSSAEIFVELKNGLYGGRDPRFHFILEWVDGSNLKHRDNYWTWLYGKGWRDETGNYWLKDTLKIINPSAIVYTGLNFKQNVRPEQITAFWIEAVMKNP